MTTRRRTLNVFNSVSLDGYICDANGDVSWAHQTDPEWTKFTEENVAGGGALLFGRTTYDMMVQYWPTAEAAKQMPMVAERMNTCPKYVASTTITKPVWNNTTVIAGDLEAEITKLLAEPGPTITILGSGSVVAQVADHVATFTIVVVPIALGNGKTMFRDIKSPLNLRLDMSRPFANGNVVMTYERAHSLP